MKIKDFKMKVTPEQNRRVQEVLFENGYSWYGGQKIVIHTDKPYLFLTKSEWLLESLPNITFSENESTYKTTDRVSELTYEQFMDKYTFKLPEKWCIKMEKQEVVDYFNKYGKIPPYFKNKEFYAHSPGFQMDNSLGTTSDHIKSGYTEITFEQFKKHVLKNEDKMEKKIVGYKLIKPEYLDAVHKIAKFAQSYTVPELEALIKLNMPNSDTIELLKDAGVLDLWFEPVYEEEFKVGDYITVIENPETSFKNGKVGKTYEIIKIDGNCLYYEKHNSIDSTRVKVRKATPEEIKNATACLMPFGGVPVIVTKGTIVLDGYTLGYEELKHAYEVLFSRPMVHGYLAEVDKLAKVTIGCKSGTLQEIEDIYECMKKLQ